VADQCWRNAHSWRAAGSHAGPVTPTSLCSARDSVAWATLGQRRSRGRQIV
jgi:hypothetical protein